MTPGIGARHRPVHQATSPVAATALTLGGQEPGQAVPSVTLAAVVVGGGSVVVVAAGDAGAAATCGAVAGPMNQPAVSTMTWTWPDV